MLCCILAVLHETILKCMPVRCKLFLLAATVCNITTRSHMNISTLHHSASLQLSSFHFISRSAGPANDDEEDDDDDAAESGQGRNWGEEGGSPSVSAQSHQEASSMQTANSQVCHAFLSQCTVSSAGSLAARKPSGCKRCFSVLCC